MEGPGDLPELPGPADRNQLDRQLANMVHHSRRYIYAILALEGLLVLVLTGVVAWLVILNNGSVTANARQIQHNQQASDRRWCGTMNLLTANPVTRPADPAANPSREASYQLYIDFLTLKQDFGCDG